MIEVSETILHEADEPDVLANLLGNKVSRLACYNKQRHSLYMPRITGRAKATLVPLLVACFMELPQPDLSRYDAIRGNLSAAITMALILPLTASIAGGRLRSECRAV